MVKLRACRRPCFRLCSRSGQDGISNLDLRFIAVAACRRDGDDSEEVDGVVVASHGDAPKVLEVPDRALDGVSVAVDAPGVEMRKPFVLDLRAIIGVPRLA